MRIIIACPEKKFSTKRPDTFTRTELRLASNLLQFGGGPYIERNQGFLINDPTVPMSWSEFWHTRVSISNSVNQVS